MLSAIWARLTVRLFDAGLNLAERPNRIDSAAKVARTAWVRGSRLHGEIEVAAYARLYRVVLSGSIVIGQNSSLWGPGIYVYAGNEQVEFGNYCSVARNVSVHGFGHDTARISTHYVGRNVLGRPIEEEIVSRGPVSIGHDVWIGTGVHIMSGITIGTGAVIGAGSVVTSDVHPYAVAVGSPTRTIGYRFSDEIISRLLDSRWWNWSHEEIRAKQALFRQPLTNQLLDEYL
jgi:acetyltransferase-like isoleucine patch superfamily enzyme